MLCERPQLSSGVGRLLCAGVWMGRAGAVRHYLSRYFLAAGHVDGRAWDDQGCALLPLGILASLAAGACLAPHTYKGDERGRCACAAQVVAQPVPGTGVCAARGGAPGPAAGHRLPRPPVPGAAGSWARLPGGCAGSLCLTMLAGASQACLFTPKAASNQGAGAACGTSDCRA